MSCCCVGGWSLGRPVVNVKDCLHSDDSGRWSLFVGNKGIIV